MIKPSDTEIDVDEIMRKIREEVKRRKKLPEQKTFQEPQPSVSKPSTIEEPEPLISESSTTEDNLSKKSFDDFLWKYGRRHKKIIKAVPILKDIAKRQHSRLARQFISSPPITQPPFPSPVDINVLPYYINYHGFLIQVKEQEGLKGRIKSFLFKFIRFFAWWQEQINRALYQELMAQKARMDERDRWVQELLNQQMNSLKNELSERDKMVEDLNNRLVHLSQAKDELYRGLSDQRAKTEEAEGRVEGLLNQQRDHVKGELAERDKVLGEFGNRLSLFGQARDELSRELSNQGVRIGEAERRMEGLLNQQRDRFRGELAERDKVVESLNNRLVQFGRVEEELNRDLTIQKKKLDGMEKETQNVLSQGIDNLKMEFTESYKNLKDTIESTRKELSGLLEVKSAISHMTQEMRDHKLEILDQHRRLTLLPEEVKKQIKDTFKEEDHLLDAMYVAFEDRFRGTREDIKERSKVYLPYVKQAEIETRRFPILDLGCGRGEWLELLKENGFVAKGIDFNRVMVRQCQEFGLDVTESDMIEYLRNQQPNSFGALTGFHILEHLPFKTVISLFDEALRVLKSGGMVIFETPNPENLIVAACNFYFDPTHRNPLPPRLLDFLIESRGFGKTEIIRLHPHSFFKEEIQVSQEIRELISLFNKEQDYAVISYKA